MEVGVAVAVEMLMTPSMEEVGAAEDVDSSLLVIVAVEA